VGAAAELPDAVSLSAASLPRAVVGVSTPVWAHVQ